MKCPQCASDLNVRDRISLPRFVDQDLTLCVFCEAVVALDKVGHTARVLEACAGCGAPIEAGSDRDHPRCASCRERVEGLLVDGDGLAEVAERIQKEVLTAFPVLPAGEPEEYFNHVLGALAARSGYERPAFRLIVSPDLGFRTASILGGVILAGREILAGLEDEAMLSFVLGRELAHHHSGRVARRFQAWRAPGPLATSLEWGLGWLTKGTLSVGRSAADLVRELAWLGYGSAHEQQADEWSIKLLALEGYDLGSAVRHLTRMEKRHLEARGALAAFLDAHPARSRRRCLAETLVALESPRVQPLRANREVYQRMAMALVRDDLVHHDAARASRTGPRVS